MSVWSSLRAAVTRSGLDAPSPRPVVVVPELVALALAARRARLDQAEALLTAGEDLPPALLLDLVGRREGAVPPRPRVEPELDRRRSGAGRGAP